MDLFVVSYKKLLKYGLIFDILSISYQGIDLQFHFLFDLFQYENK